MIQSDLVKSAGAEAHLWTSMSVVEIGIPMMAPWAASGLQVVEPGTDTIYRTSVPGTRLGHRIFLADMFSMTLLRKASFPVHWLKLQVFFESKWIVAVEGLQDESPVAILVHRRCRRFVGPVTVRSESIRRADSRLSLSRQQEFPGISCGSAAD